MTRGSVTLHILEVHNLLIQVLRQEMYVISVYYNIICMGEMIHTSRTAVERPWEDITPGGISWVDENIAGLLPQNTRQFE
jgi:hypothetical protein